MITLSEAAAKEIKSIIKDQGLAETVALRVGVKGGGCSGFSYVIQYEDTEPKERDTVYDAGGVRFYVDKKSFVYLAGTVLDYEQTLMFQGFKIKNPNEASSCGCGHSFTVR